VSCDTQKKKEGILVKKSEKLKVSERALFARINRKIHGDDLTLRRCTEARRNYQDLGDYYLLDRRINGVVGKDVGLEAYGRDVGVLKDYEVLADE
jgi:hypothetical protein